MESRDGEQGDRQLGCSSVTDRDGHISHMCDSRVESKRQAGNALVVSEVCIIGFFVGKEGVFLPR